MTRILKVINVLCFIIIACALAVMMKVVFTPSGQAPEFLGYSFFRITSGSMEPTIHIDSLAVVKHVEPEDIRVDDVITFYSDDPVLQGYPNTHRVTQIIEEEGKLYFVTKGDANQLEDKYVTSSEDLIGKVVFVSHGMGIMVHLLSNPLIFIPVILLPMFVILVSNLSRTIRLTRKIVKEEEEAAVREAVEAIRKSREEQKKE